MGDEPASVDALAFAFFFGIAFWRHSRWPLGTYAEGEPPVAPEESAAADAVASSKEELTPAARCFSSLLESTRVLLMGPAHEAACSGMSNT